MAQQVSSTAVAKHTERGDGLVEFALIAPIVLLILIGILDFGRVIYAYSVVANSAREGARRGIILADDDDGITPDEEAAIIAAARDTAAALDLSQLDVLVSQPPVAPPETIQVLVTYDFRLVTPLLAEVLGGTSFTLKSRATMYTGY